MMPLLLAALLAAAERPALDPVLDKPYHLALDDERADASGVRHFHLDRTVTFSRDTDGLVAAVTLVAITTDAQGEIGRRFLTGAGALRGRTVRFHLARDGSIRSIDEEAAIWSAIVAGVAALGNSASPRVEGIGRRPADPLIALPPDKARAAIASMVSPMIAAATPTPGSRAVTLPARGIFPPDAAPLMGTETVTRSADGTLRSTTHAASSDGNAQVTIDRTRVVDPIHGLVLAIDDRQATTLAGTTQRIRSQLHVTLPVS